MRIIWADLGCFVEFELYEWSESLACSLTKTQQKLNCQGRQTYENKGDCRTKAALPKLLQNKVMLQQNTFYRYYCR